MGRIFTSIAVSLDGFIASKSGEISWLNNAMAKGEEYGFEETMKRTGVFIMGANTYREMLKAGMGGKDAAPVYVVTSGMDLKKGNQTHFYTGDLKALADKVKTETGKDIYVWGGGNLITQFIDLNLLDELNIAIIPVLLGDGVPLFGKISQSRRLELVEYKAFEKSGIVGLKYRFVAVDARR